LRDFDWNQGLHRRRDEAIFKGPRILIPTRPLKSDNFLFRAVSVSHELIHKHNILSVKLRKEGEYIEEYAPYLGMLNSQLLGFIFFQLSTQWGKGEGKRDTIRNGDVEKLPIQSIDSPEIFQRLVVLVNAIIFKKANEQDCRVELDDLNDEVFKSFGLLEYEKEIIREFFDVRVNRSAKVQSLVRSKDIEAYFNSFSETFSLLLSNEHCLNARYRISQNLGAVISFSIDEKSKQEELTIDHELSILEFTKEKQLKTEESMRLLFEEKVKVYKQDTFYILKSNQFKDWTVRQAIKDAKEEINLFLEKLKPAHE